MKKTQAIEVLTRVFETVGKTNCEIKLINGATGETLEPDPLAVKAGIMAGVAAGITIMPSEQMPESKDDYLSMVGKIVGKAAQIYLADHLKAEAGGVDNG